MASPSIVVKILGDASGFSRAADEASGKAQGLGSKLGGLAKGAALGAAAGGLALLTKGLVDSVGAAKEAEKAQARLEQSLKGAGLSYDKYGSQIDAAVQKTSKLAALDDEELSDAFAKIVRSTGDVSKGIEGMGLAADIARARQISLESASKFVEKAMIGNAAAFKRVGVDVPKVTAAYDAARKRAEELKDAADGELTPALKAQIATMLANAKAADKAATATSAVEAAQKKFAGAAEAYGKTAAGAQERFSVAVENLQEKIGKKLLPILAKLAELGVQALEKLEQAWADIGPAIEELVGVAKPVVEEILKQVGRVAEVVGAVIKTIAALISGDWSAAWENAKKAAGAFLEALLALPRLVGEAALKAGQAVAGKILEGLGNLASSLDAKIADAASALTSPGQLLSAAAGLGGRIVSGIVGGIVDLAGGIGGKIAAAVGALVAQGGLVSGIAAVGGWIVDRVVGGITGLAGGIGGRVRDAVGALVAAGGGVVVSGVGAVGGWIKERVVDGIAGLAGGIRDAIRSAVGAVVGLGAKLVAAVGAVGGWIKERVVDGIAGIGSAIAGAIAGAINWVLDNVVNPAIRAANRAIDLANTLPGVDMGKIPEVGRVQPPPGGLGGFTDKRAHGGPVVRGLTYLVGEDGPELFTAPGNGRIVPNDRLAAPGGGGRPFVQVALTVIGELAPNARRQLADQLADDVHRALLRKQIPNVSLGLS